MGARRGKLSQHSGPQKRGFEDFFNSPNFLHLKILAADSPGSNAKIVSCRWRNKQKRQSHYPSALPFDYFLIKFYKYYDTRRRFIIQTAEPAGISDMMIMHHSERVGMFISASNSYFKPIKDRAA